MPFFVKIAVCAVWVLILGGLFFAGLSEKVNRRTGSFMLSWAIGAFVVGLVLALGLLTYLAIALPSH